MIVMVVLLSLAVAGLFLAKHENASLRASLDRVNSIASEQQTTITMLKNQLHVALTRASGKRAGAGGTASGTGERRKSVKHSARKPSRGSSMKTKIFRRWYGADLPDAVRRLRQHPACTDASDCPQRLPESEPLPDAGQ
ncbi:Rz-like lysis system protein LysB [Escherichia coli]